MDKNNFEKQVQETLAELAIQPSEKAWTGIESRIRKKDTSKRILWFLLIGLFLLAGGGYLFWQNGNGNQQLSSKLPMQKTETGKQKKAIDQMNSSGSKDERELITIKEKGQDSIHSGNKSTDSSSSNIKSLSFPEQTNVNKKVIARQSIIQDKMTRHIEIVKAGIKPKEPSKEIINTHQESRILQSDLNKDAKAEPGILAHNEREISSPANKDSMEELLTKNKINFVIKKELSSKESIDEEKTLKAGKIKNTSISSTKSWEIGVTFSAAKAYIGDGIQLGLELDKSAVANDPQNSFNNAFTRPGSSVSQNAIGPATAPENSYGFNAGVVFKKGISSKTSIQTGLGYTYYTNSILIGDQLPGDKYSSAGILSPFRNNIHFVDLPLQLQFHINTRHKIPLNLSAGINISQLVASNAVQYKSGYYKVDNSMFNKTQIGFNAGFSATFFHKLSVGPFYRYGLNSLSKEGLYGKKHLNFLGLKADFILSKNK